MISICIFLLIYFSAINCFHLKMGFYSKRREVNKVILRAVPYIVLLRCRLIYRYVDIYIHTYTYICMYVYVYIMYVDSPNSQKIHGSFTNVC